MWYSFIPLYSTFLITPNGFKTIMQTKSYPVKSYANKTYLLKTGFGTVHLANLKPDETCKFCPL